MGNVLIIKNNDSNSIIYKIAKESFENDEKKYYNSQDGSANEKYLNKIKSEFGSDGIVLFITYNGANENEIEDILIGSNVTINEKNNVEYIMKIYLSKKKESRAIESIVDKIDLDISKDFEKNCYVIMSDMESLYEELRERIISKNNNILLNENKNKIKIK